MLKKLLLVFILCNQLEIHANEYYRNKLAIAEQNEKATDEIIKELESKNDITKLGYLAVAYMMKSNHCSFPITKLRYFNKGKNTLEKAILLFPSNIELIYYRFEIQNRIPSVLGYNHKTKDKERLILYTANSENKAKDPILFEKISTTLISKH